MLLIILVGVGLGVIYYNKQKPKYRAVCTFILEEKSSGGGGLAGLASQFGLNLGNMGGGSIFAGDNILEILKSKKVVQEVLLSRIDNVDPNSKSLLDFYLDFTGTRNNWQQMPYLANIDYSAADKQMTPIEDSVMNSVYETIVTDNLSTERTSKQGTIIKVQVTSANGKFSRLMTERLVEEASKLYLDLRLGTGQENIRQLQRRSDSLLVLLNNRSYRAAASQPLDLNPGVRTAVVPVEIANRDKTVLATLYAEVTKNLEASKLLLSQQTPVVQLLDRPGHLLHDNKKSLPFIIVLSIIGSVFIYIVVSVIVFFYFITKNNVSSIQTEQLTKQY